MSRLALVVVLLCGARAWGASVDVDVGAVTWDGARAVSAEGRLELAPGALRFEWTDTAGTVRATNVRLRAGCDGIADVVTCGWADVEDGAGRTIARDAPIRAVVTGRRAVVTLGGAGWDGRSVPLPGRPGGRLEATFDTATRTGPSRDPDELVTIVDGTRVPIAGKVRVRVAKGALEALAVDVSAPAGRLTVRNVVVDGARGGVVEDGVAPHLGRVRLAVFGRCDLVDGAGRVIARDRALRVWVDPSGAGRIAVDGGMELAFGAR